ncbi:F1 capsule-anchoring protein (plasmid) [Yersinia pestis]|nr:F1 capsule-anchoring protein [Yersinia pestis]QOW12185.1 F1 capsule-anchoring protein (plasmid) [Yersinia pestis]
MMMFKGDGNNEVFKAVPVCRVNFGNIALLGTRIYF